MNVAHQAALSYTISWILLKFMSFESTMLSNHLILCSLLLLLLPAFPIIRVFSHEWALHIKWPKCWSFRFRSSPSSEYSGLISLRIHYFDGLVVQGILESPLLHVTLSPGSLFKIVPVLSTCLVCFILLGLFI